MHGQATANGLDVCLDALGQQPSMNLYTQLCFCFSLPDEASHSAITDTLTSGLQGLSTSFPWLAGKVVSEGAGQGNSGISKIKSLERLPLLVLKDLRYDASTPSMETLRQSKFPISMLDESIIAPRKTIPGSADESAADSVPVFAVQATFVTGGLLLTFVAQHQTMDMTGQHQMIRLLSKACHNEPPTPEELLSGNIARRNIIPLLGDTYKPGPELARSMVEPASTQPTSAGTGTEAQQPPAAPPKCTWAYLTFPRTSLTTLKSLAMESISPPLGYISTDDTLSAFIWQSALRARLHRLKPTAQSTFARAVDVRRYLNIPQTYPGLVQNMTYHTYTLQELVKQPLGGVASHLPSALVPQSSDLGYNTRALATFLDRAPDKSVASIAAAVDPSTDVMLSSWAGLNSYELDFDLGLGKPEAVRRPRFDPYESLVYLLPRTPEGEIAVAICLRDEDWEKLQADGELAKYARFIG